jgi:TDG/mug DNA glycosylase family protein
MAGRSVDGPVFPGGLAPVTCPEPRVLILGSYPSVLSLARGEYYGNPRNRFWAVMENLFGIRAALPYRERCSRLAESGIALWDVVASCSRPGSADSRIRNPVPNDIKGFVRSHPSVRLIALNGSTAGRLYRKSAEVPCIPFIVLPSTSPANAAMTVEEKIRAWRIVRNTGKGDATR